MKNLEEKIRALSLTATESKIADYLLINSDTLGLKTITTLSSDIGVSDASVFRFLKRLGYKGYSDFRDNCISHIEKQYAGELYPLKSGEKFFLTETHTPGNTILKSVVNHAQDNLGKIFDSINDERIQAAAHLILSCQRKYVSGFRASACCAQYMASKLILLCPLVTAITNGDASAIERLIDISENDCLIMYSFSKYSEINYSLIDIAHKNGAKILLITDHLVTPMTGKADIVMAGPINGIGFTPSYIAPMCISEALLLTINEYMDEKDRVRTEKLDQLLEQRKLY